MFSLESPHRGDSNEYTQYTIFKYKKKTKITLNLTSVNLVSGIIRFHPRVGISLYASVD